MKMITGCSKMADKVVLGARSVLRNFQSPRCKHSLHEGRFGAL